MHLTNYNLQLKGMDVDSLLHDYYTNIKDKVLTLNNLWGSAYENYRSAYGYRRK